MIEFPFIWVIEIFNEIRI